jgi:hypothetical protein
VAGTSIAWASSFEARAGARGHPESLQSEQFADESRRETEWERREDCGYTVELDQAAPRHHLGVSNCVDIFLRLASSNPLPQELDGRSMASGAASKVREQRLCYE